MKKILVPIDGTLIEEKSLKMAKDVAEKFNSEVIILYVKLPLKSILDPEKLIQNELVDFGEEDNSIEIVETARKEFEGSSNNVKVLIVEGDPASTIIDISESELCDVIIMSTHGMGKLKRFFLGSVTNKVVHHATIPVLIVR
ncbi:universal stress protein [Helicovermis profundi]|uniref:Universal stress protein n=1 Tax=Helicovermis profundi TaxID=3065157 RepID=A0AAU9E937_9FIRM|nr:universal stress protein [Clostridia bacterium S502]